MSSRFAWLVLLLVACGRTDRNDIFAPEPGVSGGGSGFGGTPGVAGAPAGAPAVAGAGGAQEVNCLYPRVGLEVVPTGDKPAQSYALSPPSPIDTLLAPRDFAAAYDVNGDAISDLLVLDQQEKPPRFRLLTTSPPPDVFDFRESDCTALRTLPAGRLLLRDLDGDGVQDFIVGRVDGVSVFFNRAEGLISAFEHYLPNPTERAPLLNVGVADLNGDQQLDLVVSFDRLIRSTALEFELRVEGYLQQGGRFDVAQTFEMTFSDGDEPMGNIYTGYLAAGRFREKDSGSVLIGGNTPFSSSFRFALESRFDGTEPRPVFAGVGQHVFQLFALPRGEQHALVLAAGPTDFFVFDLDAPVEAKLVTQGKLLFMNGMSHELGGGGEDPRTFVFDIDHDGDLDFFERDGLGGTLVLHPNLENVAFGSAQMLEVDVWGGAETPFLRVGPIGAVVGHPKRESTESAVYTVLPQGD